MTELVKIQLPVEQDEEGFPPFASESVWAKTTPTQDVYIVDNLPFLARQATLGDTVAVREIDGHFWFEHVLERSTNSLIRVVFFDRDAIEATRLSLASMGCDSEYSVDLNLLAINVPKSTTLSAVQDYLQETSGRGTLDYEEAILRHA